ncbi:MAG TPA: hypothetical protein PLS60_06145 [Arenimonas sp.]|nr:hypothetical protein [Arenimonas sp.]
MSTEVVLTDVTVALPDDSALRAEIKRQVRIRSIGFWLAAIFALIFFGLTFFSFPMMHHQKNTVSVDATIVAVERDPQNGETLMVSEFTDAEGVLHRDTQTSGYHYAWGEPQVGQRAPYVYWRSGITGDISSFPRADGILKWMFGSAGAVLGLMAIGVWFFVSRHRRLRLKLIKSGRRERGARYAIEAKTTAITMKTTVIIHQWRLTARYFEESLTAFKDCHSDWQPGLPPERLDNLTVPMILVDATDPRRYWLPVGEIHDRRPTAT